MWQELSEPAWEQRIALYKSNQQRQKMMAEQWTAFWKHSNIHFVVDGSSGSESGSSVVSSVLFKIHSYS